MLGWDRVFNCNLNFGKWSSYLEAAKYARDAGYLFMSWNGKLMFLGGDNRDIYELDIQTTDN